MTEVGDPKPFAGVTPILLVEDDAAHAELLMRNLEQCISIEAFHFVRDGEMALDYLFRRGKYVDPKSSPCPRLILLDLHLPKVDGMQVLREIRASSQFASTPVAVLTSSNASEDITEAYEGLADCFLVKPLSAENFKMAVEDMGLIPASLQRTRE